MTEQQGTLANLERAERLLALVASAEDAVKVARLAEAARVWARQSKLGTASVNHATVVKMRAERLIAEYVDRGQAAGEIMTQDQGVRSPNTSTLPDLGLSGRAVHEARQIRDRFSDDDLRTLADRATATDRLLSRDKLVRSAGWWEREAAQGRYADTAALEHADVLLVDPPWRYQVQISDVRAIENQYPTMEFGELAALSMPAGADAVLFCWATVPHLAEAAELVRTWGFEHKSGLVWVKDRLGMGYYCRVRHELLLIATRGTPPLPAPADRPDSVIEAPRAAHSAKPAVVYDLIERMYPQARKRELFARQQRPGWLPAWGLDAPGEVPAT